MKILIQLFKEFSIPLILSFSWTLYNTYDPIKGYHFDLKSSLNIFAPTFFLVSWIIGQIFRVKKQTVIENNFESLQNRLGSLLDKIETKTNQLIDYVTGGKSFPLVLIGTINSKTNVGIISISHQGDYPLYDVSIRIVDLQEFEKIKDNFNINNMHRSDKNFNIGNLIPKTALQIGDWLVQNQPKQDYNIFMFARNGSFTQMIRFRKKNEKWIFATRIKNKDNEIIYENINPEFSSVELENIFD
ncbi:hypothetical protein [Leptospira harrisiae]|uniref:hypothetical protein n=1 Tax=Leptospira harrisiae TaxID=2023189 RepID=UPI000C297170|nr:hypothetical protein [Leptospira harrisiae]PKA06416.1 hypothetical protein CH366_19215 [Leptospira harrisiae]